MSKVTRKRHQVKTKIDVALEAIQGLKTTSEIASKFGVHPAQVSQWKKTLQENLPSAFGAKPSQSTMSGSQEAALFEEIGRLEFELDWLKKKLTGSHESLRACVELEHKSLTIARQCELLCLPRSSSYYVAAPASARNLTTMRLIDEQYMKTPFYESRKIAEELTRQGHLTNRKRAQRLMRIMGLEAIYTKPRTTTVNPDHKVFPYLLRGISASKCDQIWSTDITYIPMA